MMNLKPSTVSMRKAGATGILSHDRILQITGGSLGGGERKEWLPNSLANALNRARTVGRVWKKAAVSKAGSARDLLAGMTVKESLDKVSHAVSPLATAAALYYILYQVFTETSTKRAYNRSSNSVGQAYDAWTREKILEYYWGEHIHLGYYTLDEQERGYRRKNFIQAKYDFITNMMGFGGILENNGASVGKILDVGCGIGGTSRFLAKHFSSQSSRGKATAPSQVTGITLSSEQVKRATELAQAQKVSNVEFKVMDALEMSFPDNSFDVVWACESCEHMPDKKKYVEEMMRVLKPGGRLILACWCQRDDSTVPFSKQESKELDFMCTEWSHPAFASVKQLKGYMEGAGGGAIRDENWTPYTTPSWRHSIWVGLEDPLPWVSRPHLWYKCARDAYCLNKFHNAFVSGLMEYGMVTCTKKK